MLIFRYVLTNLNFFNYFNLIVLITKSEIIILRMMAIGIYYLLKKITIWHDFKVSLKKLMSTRRSYILIILTLNRPVLFAMSQRNQIALN